MSFIVEDGTVVAGATSYVSLASADAYFADLNDPGDWSTLTDGVKQTHLMIGTKFVDDLYRGHWKGEKLTRDQELAWPRYGVYDEEGLSVASNEIPWELADAVCEAAQLSIASTVLYPEIEPVGPVRRISVDNGLFKEWFKEDTGFRESIYTTVTRLLRGLVTLTPGQRVGNIPLFRG